MTDQVSVTIYARVGDSEVLNKVGTYEVDGVYVPFAGFPPASAAPEAKGAWSVDLHDVFRKALGR